MELKDFIFATLQQIIDGVLTAQDYVGSQKINAEINPPIRAAAGNPLSCPTKEVEFDIGITTSDSAGAKGGVLRPKNVPSR